MLNVWSDFVLKLKTKYIFFFRNIFLALVHESQSVSITWYPSTAAQSSIKTVNQGVHEMPVGDRAEAFDEITMGQDDQTKIVNSIERLTLADQVQCTGNQAVTQGMIELAEIRNYYQANKMLSSADEIH